MTVLVFAEHDGTKIKSKTMATITAAASFSDEIHVLVLASERQSPALTEQAAVIAGVSQVICASADHFSCGLTEDLAAQIIEQMKRHTYSHILMSSSYLGKRVLPYLAGKLNLDCVSDCIVTENDGLGSDFFVRPVYASSLLVVEKITASPKLISIRASTFARAGKQAIPAPITIIPAAPKVSAVTRTAINKAEEVFGIAITRAKIVIGIGRGITKEELPLVEKLASMLNAAIGATRAVVEEGLVSSSAMLGQTGKTIAPDLYIAIGISGAIQHLAGVKDSKVIVAINDDLQAPIFQVANYGIVGNAKVIIPQLISALEKTPEEVA